MPAGPASRGVSLLPPVLSSVPIVITSFPSGVHFCTRWCIYAPTHTQSLWSTKIPCGLRGQSAGGSFDPPPQPCTSLPFSSNSSTVGGVVQQVPMGGFCSAYNSSSLSCSGRLVTHTCCLASTNTPVTTLMIQLFGISSGHDGST